MQIKKIQTGKFVADNNVFLAPMAGYTDFAFRGICAELNAGATYTELVSAKGIVYGGENTVKLLTVSKKENNCVAQIFGSEPDVIYQALTGEDLAPFDVVDINMGCPVPKVFKNGEGSALLTDIYKAEAIVKAAVKSGKTITAKIRIGLKDDEPFVTEDYAKMLEGAGAKLITIHGRTRERYYSGEVNFAEIEKAKKAVNIPVIANGGIFTEADADLIMDRTGADGIMLARGAIADPFLFSKLTSKEIKVSLKDIIFTQIEDMLTEFSDRYTTLNMRKFFVHYFKGRRNMRELNKMLYTCENIDELKKCLEENINMVL